MGHLTLALVTAFLVLLAQPLWSQSRDMQRAATPDWVVAVDLPLADPGRRDDTWDGVHYRLLDRQIRWQGPTRFFYDRVAVEVLERAGLEETARITRDFDPEFETLTLHQILIRRGNQLIDVTARTPHEVMRRETDLGDGLLDGALTTYLEVADLRVGDVLDIAFSWVEAPRLPGSFIDLNVAMNWSVPVAEAHLRVHWPAGLPMFERITAKGLTHRSETSAEGAVHTWVGQDLMRAEDEDDMPAWHTTQGAVALSALADWQPVAAAFLEYYGTASAASRI